MNNTQSKVREPYFDNAKIILIFLVVFGHFLQPYIEKHEVLENIYYFIFTFHMPAFIFISGYFNKNYYQKGYLLKIAKKLLFPYLMFEIIYGLFYSILDTERGFSINLIAPEWSLWFLLSLFFWCCSLLVFGKLKPSIGLSLSIFIACTIGYIDYIGQSLSISRTFVFLPFFLAGYYTTPRFIKYIQTKLSSFYSLVLFFIVFGAVTINDNMNKYWVFGSESYGHFLEDPSMGFFIRLYVYGLSFMAMFAFFIIVPNIHLIVTHLGKNTLFTYLLHGFIVKGLRETSLNELPFTALTFCIIVIMSLIVTVVLSSNTISTYLGPIMDYTKFKLVILQRKCPTKKRLSI